MPNRRHTSPSEVSLAALLVIEVFSQPPRYLYFVWARGFTICVTALFKIVRQIVTL